ncbi:DUF2147 domain-containing protein [Jiella endophytica]|uniref:DUF2147 domain-containing protein n=1 Tax=Jiella endophytica TaxID=2558362 RepID=UPI0014305755|nr:DUF2147 domain-containing protein [Jiella endophytica]
MIVAVTAEAANAAPAILGNWVAEDGTRIAVKPCGPAVCATIASGAFRGANVATVSGALPEWKGRVRDPRKDQSYDGSLRLNGRKLELRGCLARVFCRTVQTWSRP